MRRADRARDPWTEESGRWFRRGRVFDRVRSSALDRPHRPQADALVAQLRRGRIAFRHARSLGGGDEAAAPDRAHGRVAPEAQAVQWSDCRAGLAELVSAPLEDVSDDVVQPEWVRIKAANGCLVEVA